MQKCLLSHAAGMVLGGYNQAVPTCKLWGAAAQCCRLSNEVVEVAQQAVGTAGACAWLARHVECVTC